MKGTLLTEKEMVFLVLLYFTWFYMRKPEFFKIGK